MVYGGKTPLDKALQWVTNIHSNKDPAIQPKRTRMMLFTIFTSEEFQRKQFLQRLQEEASDWCRDCREHAPESVVYGIGGPYYKQQQPVFYSQQIEVVSSASL